MKNFMLCLILSTAFFTQNASANDVGEKPTLTKVLKELIGDIKLNNPRFTEETFNVEFIISKDNEIMVINTNSEEFDEVIRERLNHQEIDASIATPNKKYILPLTVVKK